MGGLEPSWPPPWATSCSSANSRIVSSIEYRVRPESRSTTSKDLRTNASSKIQDLVIVGWCRIRLQRRQLWRSNPPANTEQRSSSAFSRVTEVIVGPRHGVPKRLVPSQSPSGPDQQLESVIEPIAHFDRCHRRHPRGRQLDRQWDSVETSADLHDRGRVLGLGHREAATKRSGRVRRIGIQQRNRCRHRCPAREPTTTARRRLPTARGW